MLISTDKFPISWKSDYVLFSSFIYVTVLLWQFNSRHSLSPNIIQHEWIRNRERESEWVREREHRKHSIEIEIRLLAHFWMNWWEMVRRANPKHWFNWLDDFIVIVFFHSMSRLCVLLFDATLGLSSHSFTVYFSSSFSFFRPHSSFFCGSLQYTIRDRMYLLVLISFCLSMVCTI